MNTSIAVVSSPSISATIRTIPREDTMDSLPVIDEKTETAVVEVVKVDLEHYPVEDDPRQWSRLRKNFSLAIISIAAMIASFASNIQNPAVEEMERQLPATSNQFSLSLSLFILLQGTIPLMWSFVSEFHGRKFVYLISLSLFTVGSAVVALSKSISLVIAFRCVQAIGSSAVSSLGSATLADMFDRDERGSKMSIYISAPLLGPALGPILGGVLTSLLGWRSIFWFLTIISGITILAIILFFRDTFRKERSLVYRDVVAKRLIKLQRSLAEEKQVEKANIQHNEDVEKQKHFSPAESPFADVKISLKDVNPVRPILGVVKQKHNIVVLFASALIAAFGFIIGYTSSRTLAMNYGFDPLKIGLINLSYGSGCVISSQITGWWSDRQYAKIKALHGEVYAELRLKNSVMGGFFLPPFILALGWLSHAHVNVGALAVMLFACGCCTTWMYNSIVTYIIDSNVGRSSSATATNSAIRGVFSFIATETVVPLQSLGDGITYTVWAGLMVFCELLIVWVYLKGRSWRETPVITAKQVK